ncbi:endolytic transglycosylase MltG [Streptomyces sp. NPDC004610]|uniref:endolytic transglycosylase MltG n=1 Tax=unclassified Streptomyces TaxID=2593676 RepID=UPI0033B23A8A
MTEYGRGPGSEPWHPEDPLYGDGGWSGQQQAHAAQQPAHGGQQQYPQPQQPQQGYGGGDWESGQYGYDQQQPQPQQQQPQQPQQQMTYQDQYGQQQYGNQPYDGGQQYEGGQPYEGGWNGGGQQLPYPGTADPVDPYGQQAATGYTGGEQADFYNTPDAYPPPEPPHRRSAEPEPRTDWDPEPDQEEHAFFADDADDADDDAPRDSRDRGGRGERRGRGGKPKKSRNGCACLVVALVFGGGLAGVGYFGYQFYQDRFGAAPDFAGAGNGEQITVTIPPGAGGYVIGQELKKAGVVKSVDAFVAAQQSNPDGKAIQDGVYTLQKEMSADSALKLMLSPESRSNLIIAEGKRNAEIYTLIDKRLEVDEGTTAEVAKNDWKDLGLPEWAVGHQNVKDPLEGFLYPSSYPVAKGQEPEDVLKQMVARATDNYEELGLAKQAESVGLENAWELVTVASLVQAEGKTHDDFRKMAEVIYNRLQPDNTETNQELQFDSTFNYLKGQSKIDISETEINSNPDPYNTYTNRGLPPGPIGNPGEDAIKAALNPTEDGWMYFVATDGMSKTEFARTIAEHEELVEKFNESRGN